MSDLREAVERLPVHYRRNGFAGQTAWVTRRDVLRLIDRVVLSEATPSSEPDLDVEDDGSDPWGDVWDALDRLVPAYPEDDDDMGEIRRIVSQRQDARGSLGLSASQTPEPDIK